MAIIHETITINASRETVHSVLITPAHIRQWFVGLEAFTVSDDHPQPGSTQEWSYKVFGLTLKGTNTMLDYAPDGGFRIQMDGLVTGTQETRLTDTADGVQVELITDYQMNMGILGRLAPAVVHRVNVVNTQKSLEKIKALAESL